jgi:hypothetical protein
LLERWVRQGPFANLSNIFCFIRRVSFKCFAEKLLFGVEVEMRAGEVRFADLMLLVRG